MVRTWRLISVWIVVTAVVTFAAWQVVQAASDRVNEVPLAPVVALGPQTSITADPTSIPSTSSSIESSTTSTSSTSTSTTSTTRPQSSPTQPARGSATVPSAGGTVTVTHSGGDVFLAGATPAVGFTAEVKSEGPQEVRVEFDSEDLEVEVRIRWHDGELVTEITTND